MTGAGIKQRELAAAIEGHTLCSILDRTAQTLGAANAYGDTLGPDPALWRWVSWSDIRERSLDLAAFLIDSGVQSGDTVAILAGNRIEHVVADHAVMAVGAASVPIYLTFAQPQVAYVFEHCRPSAVIIEGPAQARVLAGLAPATPVIAIEATTEVPAGLGQLIGWDEAIETGQRLRASHPETMQSRSRSVAPTDRATILYTSGTTGDPKGVVLTHQNILFSTRSGASDEPPVDWISRIGYLPLAHIAERMMSLYVPLWSGGFVHLVRELGDLEEGLRKARPLLFLGPPRIWEKLLTTLQDRLAALPPPARAEALTAMEIGQQWVESQQFGQTSTPALEAAYEEVKPALAQLRAHVGLQRVAWAASAAAPQPRPLALAWARFGICLYDVYGMTETTASICSTGEGRFKLGTVGPAVEGVEIALAPDGELLARGPMNTDGYFANDQATTALLDESGWLHTGDIATIDSDGFVAIVDRKKELIITSSGKNIAPSNIEAQLKRDRFISQAFVYGDNRPFLVAVLVLSAKRLAELGGLNSPQTEAEVAAVVGRANQHLSRPEQVKRWVSVDREWTAETGDLTATLKLRRRILTERYQAQLDELYR